MTPIVKTLPSYIKDSQHALEIVRVVNFLGQDKLLFTMDITSLFRVILSLKHIFDERNVKNLALKKLPVEVVKYFSNSPNPLPPMSD